MKKNTKTVHRIHLHRRSILELFGLSVLIFVTALQWDTIQIAIEAIKNSDKIYILIASILFWFLLPLTPISYRLLSDKRLNIWTTTLAQLAGSGPGRIIPGGLGRLSFSVIHLIKLGFSSARSITITVVSNIIGIIVNLAILFFIFLLEPNVTSIIDERPIAPSIITVLATIILILSVYQWLLHAKSTRKSVVKFSKKWNSQIKFLQNNPFILLKLILIALLILFGLVVILLFSAYALDTQIKITEAIVALSIGVFIGGIIPTPGGVGGVEAGVATTLIFLGYSPAESTSIALLFRAITYWQPLVPGTFAYLYLRKRKLL